jgi:DNA-binding NarL/FixJ family response regulator
MVGRDDELTRGRELAVEAAAGRGRLLLIQGEPGIGKTLLLRAILDAAADLIPDVVMGATDEFDQCLPFATLHTCLQPAERHSGQAAKVLALIRDGSAENPVIDAALMLVEKRCVASPLAVAVEDLQWADPASLLLLHRLGKVAAQLPLLLAATIRGGSGRRDVEALADSWRSQDAACMRLGPLPDQAVDQFVRNLLGGAPGHTLRAILAKAAGNPLYIGELITGLVRGHCLQMVGDVIDVEPGSAGSALPPALRQAIIRWLAALSPGTRHMLEVAALIGSTFGLADVAAVIGCPAAQLLGQVREAAEAGVIVSLPDKLAFRHPLVRTVLDDDVLPSARQALHLQIAQTLASHASPEQAAGHLLAAGRAAGPLSPWLVTVADDTAARAPASRTWDGWIDETLIFADASATAAQSLGPRSAIQLTTYWHRGVRMAELDRDAEADQAFSEALQMAERGIGTDYLIWGYNCVARLRFWQGRWDEALTQVQAGLDLADPLDMARHLRGLSALIAVHRGDRSTLASLVGSLRGPWPATPPGQQPGHAMTWARALAAQADGDIPAAAAILGQAWDEVGKDQLRHLRHYIVPDLVALHVAAGDQAAALRVANSIREYASRRAAAALRRSARHACALADGDAAQLAAVADEYQQARRVLFAARACEQAASLLAAAGQAQQAQAALRQAVAGYESLKADWDLARAYSLLRTLGVHRGKGGPRRRPRSGWEAITDTERMVAGLVAEGLTNPQIGARMYLSRRTVQDHVSSIFTKLDIVSRVELAALVARRGGAVS